MKVAVYYNNKDVRVEERPRPKAGPGEILLKVKASGICGSDVMEWFRMKGAPKVLGHEVAGTVEEAGPGVSGFRPGDRVVVTHHVPCLECRHCKLGHETACDMLHSTSFHPGGFSEFVQVPKVNLDKGGVLKLPENVSFEEGSLTEPLGCVLRAQRIAGVKKGQTVLVLGSGLTGQLHIRLAKQKGARVIATDISPYRLDLARKSGADTVINGEENVPEKLREANQGNLADLVILCTGAPQAFSQAMESVERGGMVMFFAMPHPDIQIPLGELWKYEIKFALSYAASTRDLKEALDLISSGKVKVDDLITHRLPLDKAQEGFRLVADAGDSMKVVLEPNNQ